MMTPKLDSQIRGRNNLPCEFRESNDPLLWLGSNPLPCDANDFDYLRQHANRFRFLAGKVADYTQSTPNRTSVLEVGSCYLHFSALLKKSGYDVSGVDIRAFAGNRGVIERAAVLGMANRSYAVNDLGKPVTIPYEDARFDVVLCTEVIEHLTFNPVQFWSEIYRVMRDGALLFIATPNSLSLFSYLAQLKRLVLFEGIGLTVDGIFRGITSGHHWKEYSLFEVREYFQRLSSDFRFEHAEYYSCREYSGYRGVYRIILWLQEHVFPRRFKSDMLAVFRLARERGLDCKNPDEIFEEHVAESTGR